MVFYAAFNNISVRERKKNVTKMVSSEWNDLHDSKINIRLKHFINKNTISLYNDDPEIMQQ